MFRKYLKEGAVTWALPADVISQDRALLGAEEKRWEVSVGSKRPLPQKTSQTATSS